MKTLDIRKSANKVAEREIKTCKTSVTFKS